MKAILRFSPKVLTHLGEALVPNADQAILELVKNSYDADATKCEVRIDRVGSRCKIEVRDDGQGMNASQLRDHWLLLGSSTKTKTKRTPRFDRLPVGNKGLGRLAALRLGRTATIETKSRLDGQTPCQLKIDWDRFNGAESVDRVDLNITPGQLRRPGTKIVIKDAVVSERDIDRIARALALVSDPFRSDGTFLVTLGGTAVARSVRFSKKLFSYAQYRLKAELTTSGELKVRLHGAKNKLLAQDTLEHDLNTVPFTFELWEFRLARDSMSAEAYPLDHIQQWLRTFGGVHLFDGPIRIAPYGEKPVDWLELNLMRVRSPEHLPSLNNSVGRVVIDNSSGLIDQTTNRISFFENDAYRNLVDLCQRAIKWAQRIRLNIREDSRQTQRQQFQGAKELRETALQTLKDELMPAQLRRVMPIITSAIEQTELEAETLRSDVVLYRAMATAGITAVVFSHEIGQSLGLLRRRLPDILRLLPNANEEALMPLRLAQKSVERLSAYTELPMRFSKKARRKTARVHIANAVQESFDAFTPIVAEQNIAIESSIDADGMTVFGSRAMIDAIVANLVTNSVRAFRRGISNGTRRIRVKLANERGQRVVLTYGDNAGGLRDISPEDVWRPGATTTAGGTGFGLTILKDTVTDMNGKVDLTPNVRGGAEFRIYLPAERG